MENIVTDSLVLKIKKLLALGTSSNENEANLALEKARALAAEHDIDLAAVSAAKEPQKQEIGKDSVNLGQRKSITQRFVSWIIQEHFNTRLITSGSRNGGFSLYFVGTKENVEISKYVNEFLNREFMSRWHKYYESNNVSLEQRGSYIHGMYSGLDNKLRAAKQIAEKAKLESYGERTAEVTQCYALMVTSDKERLDKAVGEFFPTLRKGPAYVSRRHFSNSYQDGQTEGAKISLNKGIRSNSRGMLN